MTVIVNTPMNRPRPTFRTAPALRLALPLLAALGLAGCGGNGDAASTSTALHPVKGSVQLESGKPVTSGRVVFVSADGLSSSTGTLGSDGTFEIKTAERDGAPAGEYKVRVESTPTSTSAKVVKTALPYAKKYLDEDGSGLKATVKAEPNSLPPFKLSSKEDAPQGRGPKDRD